MRLKGALPHLCLPDAFAYYSPIEVDRGLKTTLAAGPRVLRRNHPPPTTSSNSLSGSSSLSGECVWLVALASGRYCAKLGDATLADSDLVKASNLF